MDFKKLKNKGYYIRVQKGTFNNQKHVEYSLTKDLKKDSKKIACLLNLKAVNDLIFIYSFDKIVDDKGTIWLNRPESLDFKNNQLKEALKITWSN